MNDETPDSGEEQRRPEGTDGNEGENTPNSTPNGNDNGLPDATPIPPVEPVSVPDPSSIDPTPADPAPSAGPDLSKPAEPAAPAPSSAPDLNKAPDYSQPAPPPQQNYGGQQGYGGQQNQGGQENYATQPTYDYGNAQNTLPPAPNATAVLVLGICSIVTCWCYGLFGLVLGIIALALASGATRAVNNNPSMYNHQSVSNLKTGRILAIIGLVLSVIFMLIMVGWVIFLGTAGFNSYNY
jgi:hypothetical protein